MDASKAKFNDRDADNLLNHGIFALQSFDLI